MITLKCYLTILLSVSFIFIMAGVSHASMSEEVLNLQKEWAAIKYQTEEKEQERAFKKLLATAEATVVEYQEDAEAWIWKGIIESTYAGAKGGLGALSLVKTAKVSFEQSIELDGQAMSGSAYTSLGSLYYQVPGWPIGFGSDKKAKEYLLKGLAINPNGMDANYFYADYLMKNKEYAEAQVVFEVAYNAPDRANRPLADAGRRQEIKYALDIIENKLK